MAIADDLPLLERRRIEAGVLVPVIRAMQEAFGEEAVNRVVGDAIRAVAKKQGETVRRLTKIETMDDLRTRLEGGPVADGSLTVDVVERTDTRYGFDVTNCKFVELYEQMGARDLGFLLSCGRDYAFFEGMAPGLEFTRSQTRMQGAGHCDFRYRVPGS